MRINNHRYILTISLFVCPTLYTIIVISVEKPCYIFIYIINTAVPHIRSSFTGTSVAITCISKKVVTTNAVKPRQIVGPGPLGLAALSTTNLRALLRLPRNPPLPEAARRPCSKGTTSPKSALRFSRPSYLVSRLTSTNFCPGTTNPQQVTVTNSRR